MSTREAVRLAERYEASIADLEDAAIGRLNAALDTSYRQLERELRQSYSQVASDGASLLATQQTLLITQDVGGLLQLVNSRNAPEYQQLFTNLLTTANQRGSTLADELIRARSPNSPLANLAGIPLEAAAISARDSVDRLRNHSDTFRGNATALIQQSLIQGWGPARLEREMRGQLGVVKSKAEVIARTETMNALNGAASRRYAQNGIDGEQLLTTKGDVCPFCVARVGMVFPVGKLKVPLHPRCRCTVLPWMREWEEMGISDSEFIQNFRDQRLAELDAAGFQPDLGLTPSERFAGLTQPVQPIWNLSDPLPVVARPIPTPSPVVQPAPTPTPTATVPTSSEFPESIDGLEDVRELGGSTGARLVRDPSTGQQYVLKRGANPGHLRDEFAADEAYRALGVDVPRGRLYESADGPVKLSEFIEGRPLSDLSGAELAAVRERLQQNFAADSLLGNWDVVGLDADNVLVSADGRVWRIDNGGSLRYRAMGDLKGDRWNDYPTELYTLRNPAINRQTAEAFQGLSHDDIVEQIERLGSQRRQLLSSLPAELRDDVGRRLDEMERMARISRTLEADRFNEAYRERFTRHSMGLRADGIVEQMPTRFDLAADNQVYDQDGRLFDRLRGEDSLVNQFADYVERNGGDYSQISEWAAAQASGSWSNPSQALKALIAEARENPEDYYWADGSDGAAAWLRVFRRRYDNYDETFSAYHAFNYELLSRCEMPNNDIARGMVRIYRTEGKAILKQYGITQGEGRLMTRGAAESASIFTPIEATAGNQLTIQEVPRHRILGSYFPSRDPGEDGGTFLWDAENEVVFLPEGIEFDYVGTAGTRNIKKYAAQPNYTGKPSPAASSGIPALTAEDIANIPDDVLAEMFDDGDLEDILNSI